MATYTTGFDGPDLTSSISEISTALHDLEGLPEAERNQPLAQAMIAYYRETLRAREEDERAA
ncbi:hypothetical protein BQ8794_60145 [Mesorhizobium prunaredense]|uniref:Uncharacterized protein n=1 Tax=Mesorhizobium prunaredense TaxID=1631249 RepID=A0A1R3VG50_9HYPH|nr:hypothetical protein [Mesorhizobium prunaredense]SIT58836.1 hypothetical protein BQ8794_60145 [Mesorhizobium prunaredense]